MLLKLTESDNEVIFINPSQIQFIRPVKDDKDVKSIVHINGSDIDICIKEEAEEVYHYIKRIT